MQLSAYDVDRLKKTYSTKYYCIELDICNNKREANFKSNILTLFM